MRERRVAYSELTIQTNDGAAGAWLYEPQGGGTAGIIVYMDAFGVRPAMGEIAERLASQGYYVLVPDTMYRFQPYGPFDANTAFAQEETAKQLRGMIMGTTQAMTASDTRFFIDALSNAGCTGPIGTTGYCMGGGRAIRAANDYPDRIRAAASFHGGGLASDAEDSPHRHLVGIKGRVYVGVAGVDRSFPPEQSARLAQALREAEIDHMVENYVGCAHGWAVSDHSVYCARGAERHWSRLTELFSDTLRG